MQGLSFPSFVPNRSRSLASWGRRFAYVSFWAVTALCWRSLILRAQYAVSTPPRPTSIILPEANRVPDANDRMKMNDVFQRAQNFDAANALRQKQIDDESTKLLILANDLKQKMEKLGNRPVSERLLREAEVIELLAHDVQAKMTMTVGGG
jgi:hypothetical protein